MNAELTPAEIRILDAYRIMDRRAKGETLLFAQMQAREHPSDAAIAAMIGREKARRAQAQPLVVGRGGS